MRLHPAQNTPITLDGADLHGRINAGAHAGAYGANDLKTPTEAQAQAGTYKMGRITVQGLRIAIEQPNGSVRTGKDAGGKEWSSRMAAHYGYFEATRGADGDGIDCFVGPFPESETAFLINQRNKGGGFDEHKVMLGFMSERHARGAYLDSYERGWSGLQSMVPMSIPQLRWWIKHGNKRIALTAESLPLEASKPMTTKKINWTDTQPDGVSYDQVLYELRRMDGPDGLLLDSVTMAEIMEDTDGVIALDALVVENAQLARMSERLRAIMDRSGGAVKVPAVQVSDPFRARGVTNIATVFELSDGQSVSIFFHNPDTAPNKLAPGDEMISWKWLLNKKDITIVVAPEKGKDLNPRLVAQRIMKLAEKNSPAFQKANTKRAERMGNIEAIRGRIAEKEATLNELVAQVEAARLERAQKTIQQEDANAATREEVKKWLEGSGYAVKDATMGQYTKTVGDRVMFVTAAKLLITALVVDSAKLGSAGLNPRSQDFHDALIPASEGALQPAMGYAAGFEAITGFVEGREREGVTVVPAGEAEKANSAESAPEKYEFTSESGNPVVSVRAEYLYGAGWSTGDVVAGYELSSSIDKFTSVEDVLQEAAKEFGVTNLPGVGMSYEKDAYQGTGIKHKVIGRFNGESGAPVVRITMTLDKAPAGGYAKKIWGGVNGTSLSGLIEGLNRFATQAKFDKPTEEAWAVINRLSGGEQAAVSAEEPNPIALVDAAYQFANATDAFKVRVAESIEKTDYSEFASDKAMDMKAKELGAEIHWGMGAALDGVSVSELGHAPAYTDGTGKWHSYTMEAMKRKDDAALRYIVKDATEAAEAGEKMNNPKAAQYRDEAHYASMEMQRRRKGGKQIMDSVVEGEDGVTLDAANLEIIVRRDGKQVGSISVEEFRKYGQVPKTMFIDDAIKHVNEWNKKRGDNTVFSHEFTKTLDDASDFAGGSIVGKIMQGGELKGRAVIGGDGKAMVFVGTSDDQRVQYQSVVDGKMLQAVWSDDDAADMVEWLLKPKAPAFKPSDKWVKVSAGEYEIEVPESVGMSKGARLRLLKKGAKWHDPDSGATWTTLFEAQKEAEEWFVIRGRTNAEEAASRAEVEAMAAAKAKEPAPPVEVYAFKDASDEALGLLRIGAQNPATRSTYKTAVSVEKSADTHGMAIRWEAVSALPTFDDATGGLFGDGDQGHIRGELTYNGTKLAQVYVREDGMAAFDYDKGLPEALGGAFDQFEDDYTGWNDAWDDVMYKLRKECDDRGFAQRPAVEFFIERLKHAGWSDLGTDMFTKSEDGSVAIEMSEDKNKWPKATLKAWINGAWADMPEVVTEDARESVDFPPNASEDEVLSALSELLASAETLRIWATEHPGGAEPEPAPAPAANAKDRAFFMSLIDGTYPDLDDPELVNNLEAAYQRNSEDAEMVSLFTQAINAYTTASLAETEGM